MKNLLDDDGKLYQKYLNKKVNAEKEGLHCLLTFDEFCELLRQAGLKSSDIGFKSEKKYVLARYNDKGDYVKGNCRFITQRENMKEQKATPRNTESRKRNIQKCNDFLHNCLDSEELSRRIRNGQERSEKMQKIREQQAIKRREKELAKNKSYTGTHNSQYGTFWITFWITNGFVNKKWHLDKGDLPLGFYKGRTSK